MRGVATLVAVALGVEPEPEFAAACWEATGGTPFLVRTLVEALREEQIAPVTASAPKVQDVAIVNLSRWAMLRLARLPTRRAWLGQWPFWSGPSWIRPPGWPGSHPPTPPGPPICWSGRACWTRLRFASPIHFCAAPSTVIWRWPTGPRRTGAPPCCWPKHTPTRPASPSTCWPPSRQAIAGRSNSCRLPPGRQRTRGAPESAVAYLRRALLEPPSQVVGAGLLLELGLAEFSAGQPGWHDRLADAVKSAGDDTTRIAVALLFANALRWHERAAEAIEVCDGVAARLRGSDVEGRLMLEAMAVACGVGDAATAPLIAERAGALLVWATEGSVPRQCVAAAAYVAALVNQPSDRVADLALRAITAGTGPLPEPGDPPWLPGGAFRHPSAVATLLWAERFDAAQALADAAVAEAQASANGMILPAVLAQRAWLASRRGDLTAAEADARALLDAPGPSAPRLFCNRAKSVLVEVLVERGDLDEAERTLEPLAVDLPGTSQTAVLLRHARGRLRFAQGRFDDALGDFRAAGEIASGGLTLSPSYLSWRSDAALAALACGERDTARRLSDEELELARAFGAPRALGVALRAAGLVAGGHRGEALLREAIEVLAGPDTRLEHARTRADLGALLRRSNHRVEARQLLRQAVDTAHHLGAEALALRAETELRATGARPAPSAAYRARSAHRQRASYRRAGRRRAYKPRDRPILVRHGSDGRGPPHPRLLQAGCQGQDRATGRSRCAHERGPGLRRRQLAESSFSGGGRQLPHLRRLLAGVRSMNEVGRPLSSGL